MNDPKPGFDLKVPALLDAAALSGLEGRARSLLDAAPDAIVVVDGNARIVLVNAQTERMFGYARAELVGCEVEVLVPARFRDHHRGLRQAFMALPDIRPMGAGRDLAGRRKDGTELPVEISLSPLRLDEGLLVLAAIRDISDRRRVQEELREARDQLEARVRERTAELEQANRALQAEIADRHQAEKALYQAQKMEAVGQLTGGVAHDFNNLLTVIMGNLQLLATRVQGDPLTDELIRSALKASRRGAELNRTLLAFSRRQRLAPVPVDVAEMISGMAGMLRRTLGEQVHFVVPAVEGLPAAHADPAQLETALLNLAVNARDAMPEGGTLTIEAAAADLDEHYAAREADVVPGKYVMVAVSDTGTGMDAATVARAFEPFFTTKAQGKGSGLGLAMVYGFAKQSGGHVKIYSVPGVGTTVKLFLPQAPHTAAVPATDVAMPHPTGSETILVVEDETDVRLLACRVLRGLGYRVLEAGNAAVALAILDAEPGIDLLFTDVVLPGGTNGPQLARAACKRKPGLKVLFTSGYTGNAIQQLEAFDGGIELVSKPYSLDALADAVRRRIDSGNAPRAD